jgi:hypothetical protein
MTSSCALTALTARLGAHSPSWGNDEGQQVGVDEGINAGALAVGRVTFAGPGEEDA